LKTTDKKTQQIFYVSTWYRLVTQKSPTRYRLLRTSHLCRRLVNDTTGKSPTCYRLATRKLV